MKLGIATKSGIFAGAMITVCAAFFGWLFIRYDTKSAEEALDERVNVILDNFIYYNRDYILSNNIASITRSLGNMIANRDFIYAALEDQNGNTITRAGELGEEDHIMEFLFPVDMKFLQGDSSTSETQDEITKNIRMGISLYGIREEAARLKIIVYMIIGATVLVASLYTFLGTKYVSIKPLVALISGMETIGRGKLSHRIEIKSNDEIGQMAMLFNEVAEKLSKILVSRNYVDRIIESMSDTLVVTNPDTTIRTVNSSTLNLLGYEEDELIGKPSSILFAENQGLVDAELVKNGDIINEARAYKSKNGTEIPVLFSASPVRGEDGNICYIVYTGRDVIELKEASEELRRRLDAEKRIAKELEEKTLEYSKSSEELNAFLHTVSHDLKSPLVSIQGFSSLLVDDYGDQLDDNANMYIERIQRNSEHMGLLLENVVKLSQIGKDEQKSEPVNVSDVISNATARLSRQLQEREIELIVADNMPTIWGDHNRINQVFHNLIDNASKFMGEDNQKPIIEVGYDISDQNYIFHVRDNGIGIHERYQKKIFQPFQQLSNIETEGTGVGLTIVKRIVENIGGEIWISSAEGQGTTIYFTVPERNIRREEN